MTEAEIRELKLRVGRSVFPDAERGPCPVHGGDNPTAFAVYQKNGEWLGTCHTKCSRTFDVIDFVMSTESCSFAEAVEKLNGGQFKAHPSSRAQEQSEPEVEAPLGWTADWISITQETYEKVRNWRRARGAGMTPSIETLHRFDVRENKGLIGFPYLCGGRMLNLKILKFDEADTTSSKQYFQEKLTPRKQDVLYGLDVSFQDYSDLPTEFLPEHGGFQMFHSVFLVEGEWDCMLLAECGYTALGVLNATQSVISDDILKLLSNADQLYFIADNDQPNLKTGKRAGHECRERLMKYMTDAGIQNVTAVNLPPDVKDVCCAYARSAAGLTGFKKMIDGLSWQKVVPDMNSRKVKNLGWPTISNDALHGIAGDFVRIIAPTTEADEIALLGNFLVGAGVLFGREAYATVGHVRHYPIEFLLMVGDTGAGGRKGTASSDVLPLFNTVYENFKKDRTLSGLSSGEGLINALMRKEDDTSTEFRSFLVFMSEFSAMLSVMRREGNTMSAILRNAWDAERLRVMTRKDALDVDDVNLSFIAHITPEELTEKMSDTDYANGFANRFLVMCVRRSKELPDSIPVVNLSDITARLHQALEASKGRGQVQRDSAAKELWASEYHRLTSTERSSKLVDAICGRAEAHVLRLQLLYALLDSSNVIKVEHIRAACAFWDYCERSVEHIFGGRRGNSATDKLLLALYSGPMTTNEIHKYVFGSKKTVDYVVKQLSLLEAEGLIQPTRKDGKRKKNLSAWEIAEQE